MPSDGAPCSAGLRRLAQRTMEYLARDGDAMHITLRKAMVLAYTLVTVAAVLLYTVLVYKQDGHGFDGPLIWAWLGYTFITSLAFLAALVRTRRCGERMFVMFLASCLFNVCILDLNNRSAMTARAAPIFVVIVDVMLVGRVGPRTTQVLLGAMLMWMGVMELEHGFRFGLLDVWGTLDHEMRHAVCNCERPPCSSDSPAVTSAGAGTLLFVFLLDFFFTRRFAHAAEKEQRRMQAAVATANSVAAALARFDLEEAEASLAAQGGLLPAELLGSFQMLIANLGTYKPYLPPSCLPFDSSSGTTEPKTMKGEVTGQPSQSPNDECSFSSESTCSAPSIDSPRTPLSTSSFGLTRKVLPKNRSTVSANKAFLMSKTITLLNVTAHLPPPSTPEPYAAAHERWLGAILACTRAERGVVDSFVGDHVTASFNAMRACAVHAVAALRTVHALSAKTDTGVCMTGAVGTGSACVGVLGTDTMLRQSVVGGLPGNVDELERFGDVCGYEWVCNKAAYTECRAQFALRVVLDSVVGGFGDVGCVYEVLAMDEDTSGSVEEWMYALERTKGNQFDAYNAAGALFVTKSGEGCADARLAGCQYLQSHDAEPEMVSMFEEAVERARVVEVRPRVVSGPGWPRGMRKKWLKNIAGVGSSLSSSDELDVIAL
eukprot:TRINITY_DN1994_c0_g2_i5.p1 TRINITY_DN1994_c0_g2~~TRINITY_DN1994_c0_g2_i5.p1  ORF type:complete len:659 (+),score=116.80 TRINITY_DN1994_c0_g2_i5:52-2028(+)